LFRYFVSFISLFSFLMAGSLLGSLPAAIFYSLFVDYYVSSLTGAVKRIARRAAP
jgi:ABC-type glycerol-3-phosphate transport system permease component